MNLCQDHWNRLREKIIERGLESLIATDGATAAAMMADQLNRAGIETKTDKDIVVAEIPEEEVGAENSITATNFDPLMSAYFGLLSNAMRIIELANGDPLYLMRLGPESPVIDMGPEGEGRTWPHCALCYIGLAHELTCDGCDMPKKDGFAWMLDQAADDAKEQAVELGLIKT